MQLTAHAYVVRGGTDTLPVLLKTISESGIQIEHNPDLWVRTYTSFSMDDARELRERASLRSLEAGGRVFVLAAPTIAPDAQNALLKTFEEPAAGAKFFLIVPSPEMLLPTLRSRVQFLELATTSSVSPVDATAFLKSVPDKRLELLKPLLEKGDDDKRDLSGTLAFLTELEVLLSKKPAENKSALLSLYRCRKYITDRGALAKALLEQMALLI